MDNEQLVDNYSRLIYSIARRYSYGNDLDDLYQVGMTGLIKAYEKYDASYGTKFSTYATKYVLGEVLKYVRENKLIKINKETINLGKSINRAREVLSQKMMREPTTSELSLFLEIDEKMVQDAIIATEYVKSLDYDLSNDEDKELNLYDSLAYEEKGYSDNIIDLKIELEKLSEFEQNLIRSRYYEGRSQQEVSNELGISQVQVSRVENKILTKLKTKLAS